MTSPPHRLNLMNAAAASGLLYCAAVVILSAIAKTDGFWNNLLSTPRAKTAFIAYSAAFVVPSIAFVLSARWRPTNRSTRFLRCTMLGCGIVAMGIAGFLLVVVGLNWDWKMSSP